MNERNTYMDRAKGIGILAVIIAHIGVGQFGVWLYTFHLPLFFIISGYFFQTQGEFVPFLKKKSRAYLIPYICCAIIISSFEFIKSGGSVRAFFFSLVRFGFQRRYTTLWFLATLFGAVILFWIICKKLGNGLVKLMLCSAGLSSVFILYDEFGGQFLPSNVDTSFIVLFYLALGHTWRKCDMIEHIMKWDKHILVIVLLFIVNISCTVCNYLLCGKTYEMFQGRYGIFPLTVTAACAGSLAIILVCNCCTRCNAIQWIGRNSMAFFAFHQSIGMPIMTWICYRIGIMGVENNIMEIFLAKGLIFAGTMGICFVMYIMIVKCKLGFILAKSEKH